jgi:hypothetical protein
MGQPLARSTPYKRPYHWSEHVASYLGSDPEVDHDTLHAMYELITSGLFQLVRDARFGRASSPASSSPSCQSQAPLSGKKRKRAALDGPQARQDTSAGAGAGGTAFLPLPRPRSPAAVADVVRQLHAADIKALCKQLNRPDTNSIGERFVQIKKVLSQWARVPMVPNYWLPPEQIRAIRADFVLLSHSFDLLLYTPGRRRTVKDDVMDEPSILKEWEHEVCHMRRHNMINYNFVQVRAF